MSMAEWLQRKEVETVAGRHVEQPEPVPNDRPAVWPLVIMDMAARDHVGRERYGVQLQPHNGRDALMDAYRRRALEVAVAAGVQPVLKRGVRVDLVLRPKLTARGQASKVRLDLDNCIKVALDALIGIAYEDDRQVVRLTAEIGEPVEGGGLCVAWGAA